MDDNHKQHYYDGVDIGTCEVSIALNVLGSLIDKAGDSNNLNLVRKSFSFCELLEERNLTNVERVRLYYRLANTWSAKRKILEYNVNPWDWHYPELLKEIYYLRLAIKANGFDDFYDEEKCQVYVNAANALNTLGRFVEALEMWNRALKVIPNFGMAYGNIGLGLMTYARSLYDGGHANLMMKFAYDSFVLAASKDAYYESDGYDQVKHEMQVEARNIEKNVDIDEISNFFNLHSHSLGESEEESTYREWCLSHRLVLNPLNDLGSNSIASFDVFGLPSFIVKMGEGPSLLGFFNQLKQEFVSARYMYYEGVVSEDVHFSDKEVLLLNTLDYPVYSLAIEKIKASFRLSYSIFDKVAYFINAYWKLEMKENEINFRSIWCEKKNGRWMLRSIFENYENLPMRGLYWLSKDLINHNGALKDTAEPDAEALNNVRNHLEHKYLKVHDEIWEPNRLDDKYSSHLKDNLSFSIKRKDFEEKALRILKLSRAALIYLSLAVHDEERRRAKGINKECVGEISVSTWNDEWKR